MPQAIEKKIQSRIYGHGRGWVFSPRDLADIGHRSTVASGLLRLQAKGTIRPVLRGLYEYPRFSRLLRQELAPDMDQVAGALARKFGWRIQPGGAVAANLLALSTQVPARAVYLSDGPDRSYRIGNRTLAFEHTALKEAGFKLKESGLVVQALKFIGQKKITPEAIAKLRRAIPAKLRPKLLADTKTATGWVYAAIQRMAIGESRGKSR
jgi:hypothetical protein